MDLMPEGAPEELMAKLKSFGPLDIVVHNAGGTLDISDPFCSLEDWRKVYRFNFELAVELNGLILPGMRGRKWGRLFISPPFPQWRTTGQSPIAR